MHERYLSCDPPGGCLSEGLAYRSWVSEYFQLLRRIKQLHKERATHSGW